MRGEPFSHARLLVWCKRVGDHVAKDETLAVLETDKVAIEVRSNCAGLLEELLAKEGDIVHVGAKLAKIKRT